MANPVEVFKAEKHGFDVWDDVLRYAAERTPMKDIPGPDLERMKWHGVFYRKRDTPGAYMLRIRLTGCEMSAAQARAIAFVAYQYGHGIIDVTTRANVQVQGLAIEDVPKAIERLHAAGVTAKQTGQDNVRNVYGHPLSGVDPEELIDTRSLCRQITGLFIDNRQFSNLPRKFNIALNGRDQSGIHFWTQDLAFLAHRSPENEVLFQVLIGGKQGQTPQLGRHLPVLVRPEQVLEVTHAILELFRTQGKREKRDEARFCFLVDQIGVGGVLDHLERTLPFPLLPCVAEPALPTGYEDLIGWFPQKQPGKWSMGLCVPLGRLTWQQLEGLAVASAKWGDGSMRVTPEQGVLIINIPGGFKDAVATAVARLGLSVYADSLARNVVACTGKQFCNIAVTETKAHAFQLIERLRQSSLTLHGIRIHMSGCPASCAQHHAADIGLKGVRVKRLLGTREGFDVYLGGGVSGRIHLALPYKLGVDVDQLPRLVEEVVQEFYLQQKPGQTFSAYWRERLRNQDAARVGDADYTTHVWQCENCDYQHQGEDPPVFCPRCAGLRRHFARLDQMDAGAEPATPVTVRPDGFAVVADAAAVKENAGLAVEIGAKTIALFCRNDAIHAIDNVCPHQGGSLAEGDVRDGVVKCPLHGWSFDVCTGGGAGGTAASVARYETKVEDGKVLVRVKSVGT